MSKSRVPVNPPRNVFFHCNDKYKLIGRYRWEDIQPNQICVANLYCNHEDGSEDQIQAYYTVHRLDPESGEYVQLQAADFTYPLHRELYPALVAYGKELAGPSFCETSFEFLYVHIPLHAPRQHEQSKRLS